MTSTREDLGQHIRDGIKAEIVPLFEELRRFTDRRIAELSAEVHATVQLVDFSETNLTGQLTKIHDQVAAMISVPAVSTRNSGLELEAVVQATEVAANQIMGAAEAIGDWLRDGRRDADALEGVAEKLNSIFEACSFQDVTGQRLRRAIQHLQQVETVLTGLMPGTTRQQPISLALPELQAAGPDLGQDAVDNVFSLPPAPATQPAAGSELAQDAVDQMFGPAGGQAPSPQKPAVGLDLGQNDIDRMFG